jgi:hypothetical protein
MATQVNNPAWLEWIASLMGAEPRQTQTSALPPDQFHCLLDELPLHLIPRSWRESILPSDQVDRPLFLNRSCLFLSDGSIPPELEHHRDLLNKFSLKGTIAWVRDPLTSCLQPFWIGQELAPFVWALKMGEPVPASVPLNALSVLRAAGVLMHEETAKHRAEKWLEIVNKGRDQFRDESYWPIRRLIHPFHIAALRRYYRRAIRRGAIRLGDEQSSRRYVAHNESVASFFHHQLANAVSAIVGETVKPSYVYLASYLSGAELKKHVDRAQCEFSVTLCLDFSPEPELATSWPILLDTPGGTVTVHQALGDGLVYRGTQVPHYRKRLAEGYTSTSIFFHYVPVGFLGTLD